MPSSFEQFLSDSSTSISILEYVFNLFACLLLSYFLKTVYIKYGSTLSNRESFGNIFILLSVITMIVITIVKSSLALSLGLVGALSIIRFRTAIKEPEELAYLFLSIALGLGFGANQQIPTFVGYISLVLVIIFLNYSKNNGNRNTSINLIIKSNDSQKINIDSTLKLLKSFCNGVDLRRSDESGAQIEIYFILDLIEFENINYIISGLKKIDEDVEITILDLKDD